jgi:carboxyl-terminal processing protease
VVRDSPADRAGIQRGDRIVAVDGRVVERLERDEVARLLRGEAGTQVLLTMERPEVAAPFDVALTREQIVLEPVSWAPIPGTDLVDLHLERFSEGSGAAFRQALQEILASGAAGLVLDLRGNPGGLVNEAVRAASQFLREGVVYQSEDQQGQRTPITVEPEGVAIDLPLVVIVDADSASSSEILAGALQDNGRAQLVGERTAGTGTVVNTFTLSDGSAIRVGVLRWLTPDGHTIWHEGIAPDIDVSLPRASAALEPDDLRELSPAQFRASEDEQLLRAIEVLTGGQP